MITRDQLRSLRETYSPDTRVRLVCMEDPYRPDLKEGALGTVSSVDDMGTVHVQWDCGSSLGVVYGVDRCEVLEGGCAMNNLIEKGLADLKARQDAGEHMLCPRCGRDSMKPVLATNALSRYADVYICDECGTAEAMLDFMHRPLPLEQWAVFRRDSNDPTFRDVPCEEALQVIQAEHIPRLIRIFRKLKDGCSDLPALGVEAVRECPEITQIWFQPFQVMYRASGGEIIVRFRENGGQAEVACDILPDTK